MKLHCFRISNGASPQDGTLPTTLKLLGWGDNPAIEGLNPRLGQHSLASFAANMRRRGLDRVALDFEHNTVPGSPEWKASEEPRAVAAFGVPVLRQGDGLYLEQVTYTPHGQSHGLDYIDLSPCVHLDKRTGEVDMLHSVALTRAGAVDDLHFWTLNVNLEDAGMSPAPVKKGEEDMDWKAFIIAFTGAGADASDEELAAAFEAKIKELAANNATADEVRALSASVTAIRENGLDGEITALSSELATVKEELTALSGELVAMRRRGVCEQAAREGKVIPLSAEQIAAMAPETLAEMVGKLPVTVPLERRTPEHIEALSAAAGAAVTRVARNCGIDPARVAEVNRKRD
jgi:phage I-like protein